MISRPVAFQTARLLAYRLHAADWPYYQQIQQLPDVMRFIRDIEDDAQLMQRFTQQLTATTHHSVSLWRRDDGCFAGLAGFWLDAAGQKAEIGFLLMPQQQGQGIGSELVAALIQQAWLQPTVHKLLATVTAGNEGSRKVLQKHGFVQEGCLRQQYFLQGQWHDDWVFGLLRDD